MPMSHFEALQPIAACRRDRVVLSTMTSVGLWPEFSDTQLDFAYMPSAMSHAPGLALGLAMAQPGRGVIVLNGDGSTLMNLGCLVTLAQYALPVYLVIFDNGLYEVTGGQATAGHGRVDFAAMARAAGISRSYQCDDLQEWSADAAEILDGPGPVVAVLKVQGRLGQQTPKPPRSMAEQIRRLRSALGVAE